MNNSSSKQLVRMRGVTLIELMIVVVIIAIIAAFAYPSYMQQAQKAGRADATSALLAIAAAQEKEYLTNNAYTDSLPTLGITETEADKYTLSLELTDSGGFVASAIPKGGNSQVGDKNCSVFSIDQTGAKRSDGDSGDHDSYSCW